ncbi:hypothetical protein GCM10027566_41400 [Arachidicoccus ginsenosidivorans]
MYAGQMLNASWCILAANTENSKQQTEFLRLAHVLAAYLLTGLDLLKKQTSETIRYFNCWGRSYWADLRY